MAYHHGNARAALLSAAADQLEIEGAGRLSLRQVAERAGLSRQAPYNHFTDKEALLAELVREGYERLGRSIEARADPDTPPLQRLAGAAQGYIAFGQEQPALFRLMFSRELVDLARYPAAQQAAAATFAGLTSIIATMAAEGDVSEVSLVAWSLVHGYTSLCIEAGLEDDSQRGPRAELFARTMDALARALRV